MFSFLSEFTRDVDTPSTIIVMDAEGLEQPRHYKVVPRHMLYLYAGSVAGFTLLLLGILIFTPLKEFIPGYGTAEMRQGARLNQLRLSALQDSLRAQQQYLNQLRQLMLGQIDSSFVASSEPPDITATSDGIEQPPLDQPSGNWSDHQQPALSYSRFEASNAAPFRFASVSGAKLSSIVLPALPPVDGFVTRGFDARSGHYAIDLAVEEGTMVRTIGDGYVIFADWTYEGGYAVAVQHADGYLTVYKHNQRLLKRVGDRVRVRDEIAISGNSGETSTGPHVHFELWQNGLAQDPRTYIVGN